MYGTEQRVTHYEEGGHHKVLTYIEYRAVSGVFRTIDPATQRVCPTPAPKGGGSPGGEGVGGGVNISEDARHWIGLLQYNPSTVDMVDIETPRQNKQSSF